jgi:renal tumor antigen
MHQYKLISRKGEGTFSEVLKAQSLKTGNYTAIKCMKTHFNSVDQVNALREIQALRKLSPHPNIIKLLEVLYDEPTGRLALVFELMEMNMYELIKDRKTYLAQNKVKQYMYQVFKSIELMHRNGIFHRDIKPENILISQDTVKLADFGSCRGMYSEHPYTEYISTRWYRPPECLMTDGYYDHKMDVWGAGCVMFEILSLVPIFPGNNEVDMIHRIHNVIGTPHQRVLDRFKKHATHMEFNFPARVGTGIEKLLPQNTSKDCIDLLKMLLTYDPEERISADQILKHEYFKELWDHDRQKEFQSSLTSIRLSPKQAYLPEQERSLSQVHSEYEKSPYYQQGFTLPKKGMKKSIKSHPTINKFPSLKLNLKVEGIFKPSHLVDTSTEDELEKGNTLPPLKQTSVIHLETKFHLNPHLTSKKKDESKKYINNSILKPALSNQHLFKKSKKTQMMYQSPEYIIYGKKAG